MSLGCQAGLADECNCTIFWDAFSNGDCTCLNHSQGCLLSLLFGRQAEQAPLACATPCQSSAFKSANLTCSVKGLCSVSCADSFGLGHLNAAKPWQQNMGFVVSVLLFESSLSVKRVHPLSQMSPAFGSQNAGSVGHIPGNRCCIL